MSNIRCLPPVRPVLLSFRGPDAVRFLNGQITQDVSGLGDHARSACVTDAKGKLQFMVSVFAGTDPDEILVSSTSTEGEALRERLERYLIADDVEVADLTGQLILVHASVPHPQAAFVRQIAGCFGEGFDCWLEPDADPAPTPVGRDEAETLRIDAGIPAWGKELTEGMLPPEAGLDRTSISYRKGCYIGQEVLSRLKTAGKLNRRLAAFELDGPAEEGADLLSDGRAVGSITSVSPGGGPAGTRRALGYLGKAGYGERNFPVSAAADGNEARATFIDWV